MAKDTILQVRMDADLKRQAEELYHDMGTSFSEAVRIFAKQSVLEKGMPFVVSAKRHSAYGGLSKYANEENQKLEDGAFEKAMEEKHRQNPA